jgi:hypothetical protein
MADEVRPQELLTRLLKADTEAEVIAILTEAGYWNDPDVWRHYGDVPNNWGQGGNQQSLAEAALAEKIINSVDARLMNECQVRGINPASPAAPKSIRAAVNQFFEQGTGTKLSTGGYVEDWDDEKAREVAQGITLCATGIRPSTLSVTIADCGEGQTPDRLPETILSLNKSNKTYIPFVQGQFNQGGTGALRFCGKDNLQLVISKRNPKLLDPGHGRIDEHWGFTVVRRERPADGRRVSVYTYLAPVGLGTTRTPRGGAILSFAAETLGIFPDDDGPYSRETDFGTAIKLYEYRYIGEKNNILRGKSVLSRLDLLLPEIALPVRVYEYGTSARRKDPLDVGSRRTTMLGLRRRLIDSENVEPGFPVQIPFSPQGQQLRATVFAFKPVGSERDDEDKEQDDDKPKKKLGGIRGYRKSEGVLFVRNGQTHATLPKDFFGRDSMKMRPLKDDLLIFVDCDDLSDIVREDLFMASRDRLAGNEFKNEMISCLERALRDDEDLKTLRNRRQQERIGARLEEDRPFQQVLDSLIRNSPNLTALLQLGQRITAPFNTIPVAAAKKLFKGEVYPKFFKIKGVEYGQALDRQCPINFGMRFTFETDARDDYFTRRIERGEFSLTYTDSSGVLKLASPVGPNLRSGIATVGVELPDGVEVGDKLTYTAEVRDSRGQFENRINVTVKPEAAKSSGGGGRRNPPDQEKKGNERERPRRLGQPQIKPVYREEWDKHGFDEFTAMKIDPIGYTGEAEDIELYEFKVNMDNVGLLNEIKEKRLNDPGARKQFMYANVLVGLSILLQDKNQPKKAADAPNGEAAQPSVEDRVDSTCRALAPFMLALTSLGGMDFSEVESVEGLEESA